MNKVLFLVAGEQQVEGIKYALSKGYEVHTLDNNPKNPGHDIADFAHYIDVYDEEQVLEIAQAMQPEAVVNFVSSHGLLTGIKLRELLGLKGINQNAYITISSKDKFRNFLVQNKMPSPKVYEIEEVGKALENQDLIAKPLKGGGSRGVVKIDSEKAMLSFLEHAPVKEEYIIEEYINYSHRLNGDCFVINNKIYFMVVGDYYYDAFNGLVAYATAFPSNYDRHAVENYLSSFVEKINYGTGAMNFEFIVRDDELYCIEINPRHSGNYIHEVISQVYGIRAAELNVDVLLNKKSQKELLEINQKFSLMDRRFFATVLMYSEVEGHFEKIKISDEIKPSVIKLIEFKAKGDKVSRFESLYDRVGLAVMEFESQVQMNSLLLSFRDYYTVELR